MKKHYLLILIGGLLISTATFQGCKTSPSSAVVKTEGVVITSVDTAMTFWAQWVKAGKATQPQVDTIKTAYQKYYDAQMAAKVVIEKWLVTGGTNAVVVAEASTQVTAAQTTLLNLVNTYIKP